MPVKKGIRDATMIRKNVATIRFNQKEKEVLDHFCRKYKVANKAKFMRETIMTEILKRFDEDYPTLFEVEKPNLFNQG